MPALSSQTLLATSLVRIRDVHCSACRGRHEGAAECAAVSQIVIPYRGSFARRVGGRTVYADVNQALFFSAGQEYRIDHHADDGDACLSLQLRADAIQELGAAHAITDSTATGFRQLQRRIDPTLQYQAARLRGTCDDLQAEELALKIARRLLNETIADGTTTPSARRIVERTKQLLHASPRRRWSLGEMAGEVGTSPVHLTQTFSKVEGMPLYRYQTQLRLALALQELPRATDLAALALDLGFSSHSQFSTAFKRGFGIAPSAYRHESLKNRKALAGRAP